MAKPASLPTAATDHAADQALARLAELPPVTPPEPPTHAFPETSVALPDQARVPDAVQLPEWLI